MSRYSNSALRDKPNVYSIISEICIYGLLFYNAWILRIVGIIPVIHWIFFLGLVGSLVLRRNIKYIFNYENKTSLWFWIFTVVTGVTSILVAVDMAVAREKILDNVEIAIIIGAIIVLSEEKKTCQRIIKMFALIMLICAATAVLQNKDFGGRLILGNGNPNELGIKMVYGISAVLLIEKADKKIFAALKVAAVVFMFYTAIQSGSRKALIIAILVLGCWAIFVLPKILSKRYKFLTFIIYLMLIGFIVYAVYSYLPEFYGTKVYRRFLSIDEGADDRLSIFKNAIEMFKDHPIIGVGLNNFKMYASSGLYAHSTPAELLADTGIIGSIPWIGFLITYIKDFITLLQVPSVRNNENYIICAISFVGIMVMSIVVIIFFDFASMVFLAIIAAVLDNHKHSFTARRVERKYR